MDGRIIDSSVQGTVQSTCCSIGGLAAQTNSSCTIFNSSANVSLISNGDVHEEAAAGGLVGKAGGDYSDSGVFIVRNSFSEGTIRTNGSSGGLVGRTTSVSVLENSNSEMNIEGTHECAVAGGLIGSSDSTTYIGNSYSTGNILSTGDFSGGILGSAGGFCGEGFAYLSSVFSAGNITSSKTAGGLIGGGDSCSDEGAVLITDSYATGSVRVENYCDCPGNDCDPCSCGDDTYAGGLIGYFGSGKIINSMALNRAVEGPSAVHRLVGAGSVCPFACPTEPSTISVINSYGWNLMKNGGSLFEENLVNGLNITCRQVWNQYPNGPAPWTEWRPDLNLNTYSLFKLPVPGWQTETVVADAGHLIP